MANRAAQPAKDDARKTPKLFECSYKVFPDYHGEVVFCKIRCPSLECRAQPSQTATVIGKKKESEIIMIRNDNAAPDPESGWMEIVDFPQHVFVPTSVREQDLEPLPYASFEVLEVIRRGVGLNLSQAENLIARRVQKVMQDPRYCRGQVVQIGFLDGDDDWKAKFGEAYTRPVASNLRSNLLVYTDGATRFIRTGRIFRKGELLEACRVFPLKDSPGEALRPFAVELGDGSFGMPLGYAAFYTQAASAAEANAEAWLAEWSVGGGYVLLIKALTTIFNAQVPVVFGKPKRLEAPWTLDAPPKPKGWALTMEKLFGAETGGLVNWGASKLHGAGVFAMEARPKGSVLELCPTLSLDAQSELAAQDYCMTFDAFGTVEPEAHCLNLGLGSLYNHSDRSNADYWYDRSLSTLAIIALEDIPAGAEIFINYGEGYWKSRKDLKR